MSDLQSLRFNDNYDASCAQEFSNECLGNCDCECSGPDCINDCDCSDCSQ